MKQDGTFEERTERVRWLGEYRMSSALEQDAVYRLKKEALQASGMSSRDISQYFFGGRVMAFPYAATPQLKSSGTQKTLTLLIDFKDHRAEKELPGMTPDIFRQNIYGAGTAAAQRCKPYESVNAYYKRASQGKVDIQGNVLGWYHFPKNRNEYEPPAGLPEDQRAAANNLAIFKIVSEALNSLGASHDFAQYDNNNDGNIGLVTILYAGPNTGWFGFWWAYQWNFFVPDAETTTFGGKKLKQFVFSFVEKRDGSDFDPTTLVHETGHAFGLADYYDYNGKNGGVGGIDMMDANKGNQNAFSRWLLDWIQPEIIGGGSPAVHQLVASGSINNAHKAIAIFPKLHNGNAPGQEMFIVENRFRVGNDSGLARLPSDGLLVWHVAADPDAANTGFLYDNSYTERKLIRLMRADSADDFPYRVPAGPGTYFIPPREFTPNSTPNTNSYTGEGTNIVLTNISEPGETMSLKIGFLPSSSPSPPAKQAPAAQQSAEPSPPAKQAAAQQSAEAPKQDVDLSQMEKLLSEYRNATPEVLKTAWQEALKESPEQRASRQSEVVRQLILTQWAAKDGNAAVQALLEQPTNEFTKEAFSRVMETWANHNPASASKWYFAAGNQKEMENRDLAAGKLFAEPVFKWYAQNDYKKAVSLLDKVQVSEIGGALNSIKEVATTEGTASFLAGEVAKLKRNRNAVDAVNQMQEATELFEKQETNPRTKEEFRKLLHQSGDRSPER
jgi:M6 family metalloprotease-like protein